MEAPPEAAGSRANAARRAATDAPRSRPQPAFELKGIVAPLTVLRLRSTDTVIIERQLRIKIAEMPQFFLHAPVLLDLAELGPAALGLAFGEIAATLRSCKMVPVAITNAEEDVRVEAAKAGFGFVAPPSARLAGRGETAPSGMVASPPVAEPTPPPAPISMTAPAPAVANPSAPDGRNAQGAQVQGAPARPGPRPHRPPMVIRQPVRGGQIIYAERNDLVVLAAVNPGAEVIADGNVHVYATLRGRVVAGAQGFTDARIFCQRLEAELIAISGAYMLADDIPPEFRGKPVQIFLEDGHCRIAAL